MRARLLLLALLVLLVTLAAPATSLAADWKGSFNASYQAAKPGDTIVVPAGTIAGDQVIAPRADLKNLPVPCAPGQTAACIHFVTAGQTTVNGVLEIRGSSVWVEGNCSQRIRFNGYVDTEANSNATRPDGVIVDCTSSPNFGVFNAERVWFRNLDVGPATVTGVGCGIREGRGMENKIGFGGEVTFVPKDIVLDGLHVHDQNGDKGRELGDCHYGGLFLVTVDGLTIRNSVFERNVVYSTQVQNFEGPPAKRVLLEHNSFGCGVGWLYEGARCEQRPLQFDYPVGGEFTLKDNLSANGPGGFYGCYVGTCGGVDADNHPLSVKARETGTIDFPPSPTAPPLTVAEPPKAACSDGLDNDGDGKIDYPADPGCSSATDPDETNVVVSTCTGSGGTGSLALTKLSETATTITLGWTPVPGADGYKFFTSGVPGKYSSTNDPLRSTVKFGKIPAGGCYYVRASMPGAGGGFSASIRAT